MADWIKCSERLPKNEKPVLVFVYGEAVTASYWVPSEKHHGESGWADCFSSDTLEGVTHWQPLPPPPEQE